MVIFGLEAIASLKVAVITMTRPGLNVLSLSLVVIVTVGVDESTINVIFCDPET